MYYLPTKIAFWSDHVSGSTSDPTDDLNLKFKFEFGSSHERFDVWPRPKISYHQKVEGQLFSNLNQQTVSYDSPDTKKQLLL